MSFQAARRIVCDDPGVSPSIHIESSRLLIISQARDDRFDDPASASPRHLIVPFKYEFPSPAVIPPSHLKDAQHPYIPYIGMGFIVEPAKEKH
jgi:hypothetical protein